MVTRSAESIFNQLKNYEIESGTEHAVDWRPTAFTIVLLVMFIFII